MNNMERKSATELNLKTPEKITSILIAIVFSWLCYCYQITTPPCCDASNYMTIAIDNIARGDLIADASGTRLYGYPLFVAMNIKLANLVLLQVKFILYIVQVSLYLVGVCLVSRQIAFAFSRNFANVCFFSLLANIFIYPYLAISLTDGFSVTLLLFICYVILKLFSEPFPLFLNQKSTLLSIVLGFLTGFAIMVRPANISWILLLIPVIIMWTLHCHNRWYSIGQILAICVGFALAVTPQLQLNWDKFGKFTFLPTYDLGSAQIHWGIASIKYATSMVNGPAGLTYINPAIHGSSETIAWYFDNPLAGAKTILMHIFAAFDFDYLFPYIRNYKPKYQFLCFIYSHVVLFWSTVGYVLAIFGLRDTFSVSLQTKSIQQIGLALYACLVLGWIAVYALSAVENRFALPVFVVMLPLAAWALFVKVRYLECRKWLYGLFGVYLLLAWQLSSYISSLKVI